MPMKKIFLLIFCAICFASSGVEPSKIIEVRICPMRSPAKNSQEVEILIEYKNVTNAPLNMPVPDRLNEKWIINGCYTTATLAAREGSSHKMVRIASGKTYSVTRNLGNGYSYVFIEDRPITTWEAYVSHSKANLKPIFEKAGKYTIMLKVHTVWDKNNPYRLATSNETAIYVSH